MTGVLATDTPSLLIHHLQHVAVTDLGAGERDAEGLQRQLQTHVGHQGANHAPLEAAVAQGIARDDIEDLVPVDDVAGAVHHHQAIAVTVEGDTEVGLALQHLGRQRLRGGGADAIVDVETIRAATDGDHLGSQLAEHGRSDVIGGAMTAIHHHLQPFQAQVAREGALAELDVAAGRIVDALCLAKLR